MMRAVRRLAAMGLIAAISVACGDPSESALIVGDYDSVLLVFEAGASPRVEAYAADPRSTVEIPPTATRVFALLFDQPLEELGLAPGELEVESSGRPVADGVAEIRALNPDRLDAGWETVAVPPATLVNLAISARGPSPCHSFVTDEIQTLSELVDDQPADVLAFRDGGRLIILRSGSSFELRSDLSMEEVATSTGGRPQSAFYDAAEDELWLTLLPDRIVRGRVGEPFVEAPGLGLEAGEQVYRIRGGRDAQGELELYATTNTGSLFAFDGARWTQLRVGSGGDVARSDLAWIGPGDVIGLDPGGQYVFELEGTVVETRLAPSDSLFRDALFTVRSTQLGPVIGTKRGRLFIRSDGNWETLLEPQIDNSRVWEVADFGGGLLFGGDQGLLHQYYPGSEVECEPQGVTPFSLYAFLPGDGAIALVGALRAGWALPWVIAR